jgi:hypothetical protein
MDELSGPTSEASEVAIFSIRRACSELIPQERINWIMLPGLRSSVPAIEADSPKMQGWLIEP